MVQSHCCKKKKIQIFYSYISNVWKKYARCSGYLWRTDWGVGREKVFPFISRGTFYRMPNGQVLKVSQRGGQSVCIIYITTLSSQFCIEMWGADLRCNSFLGPSAERDVPWPLRCPFVSLKRWSLSTKGGEKQPIWRESHFSLTASFFSPFFSYFLLCLTPDRLS